MRRFIPGPAGGSAVEGEGIRIPRGETAPTLETAPPLTLDDKPSWKQALSAMDTEKFDLSLPAISSMQPFKTLARLLVYVESLRKGGSSSGGAHLLVRDPTGRAKVVGTPRLLHTLNVLNPHRCHWCDVLSISTQ